MYAITLVLPEVSPITVSTFNSILGSFNIPKELNSDLIVGKQALKASNTLLPKRNIPWPSGNLDPKVSTVIPAISSGFIEPLSKANCCLPFCVTIFNVVLTPSIFTAAGVSCNDLTESANTLTKSVPVFTLSKSNG